MTPKGHFQIKWPLNIDKKNKLKLTQFKECVAKNLNTRIKIGNVAEYMKNITKCSWKAENLLPNPIFFMYHLDQQK